MLEISMPVGLLEQLSSISRTSVGILRHFKDSVVRRVTEKASRKAHIA